MTMVSNLYTYFELILFLFSLTFLVYFYLKRSGFGIHVLHEKYVGSIQMKQLYNRTLEISSGRSILCSTYEFNLITRSTQSKARQVCQLNSTVFHLTMRTVQCIKHQA